MTNHKHSTHEGEVIDESKDENKTSQSTSLRLATRFLPPALIEKNATESWPTAKIAAVVVGLIVLAGLIGLYTYGSSLAVAV